MSAPCRSSSSCTDQQDTEEDELQHFKRPRISKMNRLVTDKDLEERMVKPWEKYTSTLLMNLLQMNLL